MTRLAGVDPGTVSFDLCVLHDGEPVVAQVFETGSLSDDSAPLLDALAHHGPYDLIYGPSGYGLPLVKAADVGERELAAMVLVRADEARADAGVGGMRSLLRTLAGSGLPVIFGPGVIQLPSVPRHRKYNRIDIGTADKVCAAVYAIVDQSTRRAIAIHETAMILLKLGGAFTPPSRSPAARPSTGWAGRRDHSGRVPPARSTVNSRTYSARRSARTRCTGAGRRIRLARLPESIVAWPRPSPKSPR